MKMKKIIAVFVVFIQICLLCFTGCGKRLGDDAETGGMTGANGNYKEYEISQVGDFENIYTFKEFQNTYTLVCMNKKAEICVYKSSDNGLNWELSEDSEKIASIIGDGLIDAADVNDKGEYVFARFKDASSPIEIVLIDESGKENTFTIEENVKHIRFTNDGTRLLVNTGNQVMGYDRNGTLLTTYPVSGCLDLCETSDGSIIFLTPTALYQYSKDNNQEIMDTFLTDNLLEELNDAQRSIDGVIGGYVGVLEIDKEDNLYILLSSGIYRHKIGSNLIEQIVDEAGTRFVGGRGGMCDFLSVGEDFYVLLTEGAILRYTMLDEEEVAIHTEESDTAKLEDAKLTIYGLYRSDLLEQAVAIFTTRYPNIEVNIEIGIEEDSGISVNDAINALNTELLSGEGPDILVLTGLDIDTYADNGMLMELSEVYDKVESNHPDIFLNILDAYRRDDGFIYALPTRFSAPVVAAEKGVLPTLKDIDAIIDCIDTGKDYPKGNALGIYYADELFNAFYPAYVNSVFDGDGNYHSDALERFVEDMKRIWEILRAQTTVEEQEKADEEKDNNKNNMSEEIGALIEREQSEQDIGISSIAFPVQFYWLVILMNKDDSYAFQSFSYDECNIFEPKFTVGINSETAYSEAAKCFVEELYDDEIQLIYSGDQERGEPLNLEPELEFYEGAGSKTFICSFPTEELRDYMMDFFKGLDTPAIINPIISEIILTDFEAYLNGDISLEEYMDSVDSAIALYMSE